MFKKEKLSNGLPVIISPLKETQVVTILVMFGVGSRYETRPIRGLSHFIEHMMFKGTAKRPDAQTLTRAIDSLGGVSNAFTSKDTTGYYIKINAKHLERALEILSDMLLHSKFSTTEINREKGVILEEINMREDNPMIHIEDLFEIVLLGDQPVGWDTAGTRQTIRRMQRKDFIAYVQNHYQAGNAVIGLAGAVKPNEGRALVKKYFEKMPAGRPSVPQPVDLEFSRREIHLAYRNSEQTHLGLGFPAYSYTHPDLMTQEVLATILGGNMSSRLFSVVREKHGLAYYIRTLTGQYSDTGVFLIQSGLDTKRVELALKLIMAELKRITRLSVPAEELSRAKEYLKGRLAIQMEDSGNLINWQLQQHLMEKKIKTVTEKFQEIDRVTAAKVKRVAADLIRENRLNLALIGPFKDKQKFDRLTCFSR